MVLNAYQWREDIDPQRSFLGVQKESWVENPRWGLWAFFFSALALRGPVQILSCISYYRLKCWSDYVLQNRGTSLAWQSSLKQNMWLKGPLPSHPGDGQNHTERWTPEDFPVFHEGNYPLAGQGLGDLEYSLTSEEKEEMQMTSSVPGSRPSTCCVPGLEPDFFFFFSHNIQVWDSLTENKESKLVWLHAKSFPLVVVYGNRYWEGFETRAGFGRKKCWHKLQVSLTEQGRKLQHSCLMPAVPKGARSHTATRKAVSSEMSGM